MYYADPTSEDFFSLEPTGGPSLGGTLVTIRADGLDALGSHRPPASGQARCRWGTWNDELGVYPESEAVSVDGTHIVCSTLAQSVGVEVAADQVLMIVTTPYCSQSLSQY